MSKKFNIVINALIILLIIVLVYVMMNYYSNPVQIPSNTEDVGGKKIIIDKNGENPTEGMKKTNIKLEELIITNTESENHENESGDRINIANSPIIMSSQDETSNKEKREVLSEIDKTLMELLEVVDKVKPVDEARLITDDSEVQE